MAHGWRKYPDTEREALGRLVRDTRRRLGLSLRGLAEGAGLGPGYRGVLSGFEAGKRDLPQTARKPYLHRVIDVLATEAREQGLEVDVAPLWSAAGLEPEGHIAHRLSLRSGVPTEIGALAPPPSAASGAVAPAEPKPSVEPHDPTAGGYSSLMEQGHAASALQEHGRAQGRYAAAAAAAVLPTDVSMALASQAYATRRLGDLVGAWRLSKRALATLGLTDLVPERGLTPQAVGARVTEGAVMSAFAMTTRVRLHLAIDCEEVAVAERCSRTLATLGEAMGSEQTRADAMLFAGRARVLRGTDLGEGEQFLRVVDAALVAEGLSCIERAGRLGRDNDDLWRAHHLHQRARAVRLLRGGGRAASRAADAAREAFAGSWAIANLELTQAQFELEEGRDEAKVADRLTAALAHGQAIGSRLLIADTLGAFAELRSLSRSTRLEAVACCLAGVAVWPEGPSVRGLRRLERLYRDLAADAKEADEALCAAHDARDTVERFGVDDRVRSFLARSSGIRS